MSNLNQHLGLISFEQPNGAFMGGQLGYITKEITATLGDSTQVSLGYLPNAITSSLGDDPSIGLGGAALVTVGVLALVGLGVVYNKWAYDDWTCMFKNCVQSSTKRGR